MRHSVTSLGGRASSYNIHSRARSYSAEMGAPCIASKDFHGLSLRFFGCVRPTTTSIGHCEDTALCSRFQVAVSWTPRCQVPLPRTGGLSTRNPLTENRKTKPDQGDRPPGPGIVADPDQPGAGFTAQRTPVARVDLLCDGEGSTRYAVRCTQDGML
jgi:hypothetical protein